MKHAQMKVLTQYVTKHPDAVDVANKIIEISNLGFLPPEVCNVLHEVTMEIINQSKPTGYASTNVDTNRIPCAHCGRKIAKHWMVRHVDAYHK